MQPKRAIAVFLPEFGLWREIVLGFHEAAVTAGWVIYVYSDVQGFMLESLKNPDVQGVLVGATTAKAVLSSGFGSKMVVGVEVDVARLGIATVRVDDACIGRMAADHMLNQGQRQFAAFGWPQPFFLARMNAFEHRVLEAGGQFFGRWNDADREWGEGKNDQWEASIRSWVERLPRPVAILAGTDGWGRALNALMYRWGIRVPEDVAVIGVDNDSLACETSIPPLSSVAVPWRRVGAEAARLMQEGFTSAMNRSQPRSPVLIQPSGVVARRSSDMLAVEDKNVADALRIIREGATEPLNVSDILKRVPVGRHALQRAFRKHVGRTMLDEVRRVRVERAKSLLVTTDLSMPEVAVRSGFSSAPKLSEMFRRETGTTPGKYRRVFWTS